MRSEVYLPKKCIIIQICFQRAGGGGGYTNYLDRDVNVTLIKIFTFKRRRFHTLLWVNFTMENLRSKIKVRSIFQKSRGSRETLFIFSLVAGAKKHTWNTDIITKHKATEGSKNPTCYNVSCHFRFERRVCARQCRVCARHLYSVKKRRALILQTPNNKNILFFFVYIELYISIYSYVVEREQERATLFIYSASFSFG